MIRIVKWLSGLLLMVLAFMAAPAKAQTYGLYQTCQLQTATGQAVAGAQVYFLTQPANTSALTPLASVYSSSTGGSVTQPVTTNGFGTCTAYLSPGLYTVCYVSSYTGTNCFADQSIPADQADPVFPGTVTAPNVVSSVNRQISVMAPPYNAAGDCVTDDSAAITAALRAADAQWSAGASNYSNPPEVYFPTPPGGCYLTSTIPWYGESLRGPGTGNGGSSVGKGGVVLKGEPGEDVLHVPDPTTNTFIWFNNWAINNIAFIVDASEDVSSTVGAHRWPGRWFNDAAMTQGSAVFTSSNANITCGDVGQAIQVNGAGASGANLVTTIASVTPCWTSLDSQTYVWRTVTLSTTASTTVSGAAAYISVAGEPVTATIGNCGIAMDNKDGNPANWASSSQLSGNSYNVLHNVQVTSTNALTNNVCALYTQGVWGFYGSDARNIGIYAIDYGIVQGTSELNSYYQSSSNDFQVWDHMAMINLNRPWISYNGGFNTLKNVEITAGYGPIFLNDANRWSDNSSHLALDLTELEGTPLSSTNSTRINSNYAILDGSRLVNGTTVGFLEGNNIRCRNCANGGTLQIDGSGAYIELEQSGATVTDNGFGNIVNVGDGSTYLNGIPRANARTNLAKAIGVYGVPSADLADLGWYPSEQDLWFWPRDAAVSTSSGSYASQIQADSTAPTGYEFVVSSGTTFGGFQQFNSGAWATSLGQLTVGTHFPATSLMFYFLAKCPSGTTSFSPGFIVNGTLLAGTTAACTTSWQTYSFHVTGLSSYSGGSASLGNSFNTATYYVAWYYIKPDAPDYNGYTPAHAGANADITSLTGLTTPLSTAEGGTGAGVLTGYRYANGSSADTASTTIPSSTITGTGGANSAAAGYVGEVIASTVPSGSAVSLTTGTATVIASVSLTAGNWSVEASANFVAASATTVSGAVHEISINSGTGCSSAAQVTDGTEVYVTDPVLTTASAKFGGSLPLKVERLAATTTVCLVATGTFTAGSETAYGALVARRAY